MKPIDAVSLNGTQRLQSAASSPVSRAKSVRAVASEDGAAVAAQASDAAKRTSAGAEPPVDGERVAEIRKAVEQGTYPLLPTKVADAMIAAGYLLRTKS